MIVETFQSNIMGSLQLGAFIMRYLKIAAKPQYFFNLFSKRSNFSHKNAAEPQYLGKIE